ncbi:MAG: type IV pilus twitching motility protein PilT [Deltaproteobacteria bacterium]|nr:type IV pilus twitching motility protein PilT [Deltaproteobacteria bacterium]MCB9786032.1 type IV pilus twitching motility protein PilT [Deltaproteobacteria bacterium]
MEIDQILLFAVKHGISDIHLKVDKPPYFRKDGVMVTQKGVPAVTADMLSRWLAVLGSREAVAEFNATQEADFAYVLEGVGRFRVNAFQQRGSVGLVLRHIPPRVLGFEELKLPPVLARVAMAQRGLIVVTGATGSGKSTTLAAMIEHINKSRACHILTIEDPIEFTFEDRRSVVNQREVGRDTRSFGRALKAAMRQDPDVILIGELRDLETVETAMHAAETGHLVLATLHTVDAMETISRIIGLFPPHQQDQVRTQLSSILKAVVSQRLVRTVDGARAAACEILIQTEFIRDLIADANRTHELPNAIAQGQGSYGMQTFDQGLYALWKAGRISQEEALANATNPADLRMKFEGIGGG